MQINTFHSGELADFTTLKEAVDWFNINANTSTNNNDVVTIQDLNIFGLAL